MCGMFSSIKVKTNCRFDGSSRYVLVAVDRVVDARDTTHPFPPGPNDATLPAFRSKYGQTLMKMRLQNLHGICSRWLFSIAECGTFRGRGGDSGEGGVGPGRAFQPGEYLFCFLSAPQEGG